MTRHNNPLSPKVVGSTPAGCSKTLQISGLQKRCNTTVTSSSVFLALPLPFFAFFIPLNWVQRAFFFSAPIFFVVCIGKVVFLLTERRRERARMAAYLARRSTRWAEGGRK